MRAVILIAVVLLHIGRQASAQTKSEADLKLQRKEAMERFEKTAAEAERLRALVAEQSARETSKDDQKTNEAFESFSNSNSDSAFEQLDKEAQETTTKTFSSNSIDKAASNSLKSVTIGKQVWTANNLSTDRFKNGDLIPEAKTAEEWQAAHSAGQPAWCYYKNDPSHAVTYGRLYNWFAVIDPRGLAPAGWHIPSITEWDALTAQLGGGYDAGVKMRSTTGWKKSATDDTNESGFNAQPSSCRGYDGKFLQDGLTAYWWTSTPFEGLSTGYGVDLDWGSMAGKNIYLTWGLSVRCVQD